MSEFEIHKDLGYELMSMMEENFVGSKLTGENASGVYQTLALKDGSTIKFRTWRNDLPFYFRGCPR